MDEILIEEKKYISSKRAAKVTGYAKDYIGQLCREGRVPARLIGRGWYVLESAIQDHRFSDRAEEKPKKSAEAPKSVFQSTWESPRYEAVSEDALPPVKQAREESPQNIQDSWKAWFDRFDHSAETETPENTATIEAEEEKKEFIQEESAPIAEKISREKKDEEERVEEGKNVDIPIHAVYKPLPAELLPHRSARVQEREEEEPQRVSPIRHSRRIGSRTAVIALQLVGIILAIATAGTAVIGSGCLDKYIVSYNQASFVAGVLLYNK
jgi:hypothetical protein